MANEGTPAASRLPQLLLGLIVVAIAVVITAFVIAGAIRDVERARDTITVTGSARQPITSDLVSWNLSISAQDADPAVAARRLRSEEASVRRFLRTGGLDDGDVREPPLQTEQVSARVPGRPRERRTEYLLTQSFTVDSRDVDTVEDVSGNVTDLLEQGIPVSVDPLSYVSTRLALARRKALERATADAHRRAETIVKGIGSDLGGVRKASLGVYQIVPRNSTEVSDYGINDTSSRDKDVIAVVTVTFAVH